MNSKRLSRFVPKGRGMVVILYAAFFMLLLGRAAGGVGQYWDWVFPYYTSEIGNFFGRAAEAWTSDGNGSPLGYSTDYLLRFFIGLFRFVPPELLLFGVLVATFTVGAYLTYLIARRHTGAGTAFLLGLMAFVNPVIFYNFIAGYVDYLVAYAAFIYLVYFLLYRYRATLRSAIVLGLVVAVIGVQIQLFVVAGICIGLFFVFRPDVWRLRYGVVSMAIPILLSLVWLSNFLFGGANLAAVSGQAAKATFKGLTDANYLNIFSFSFSKATLISRFYSTPELLLYGLLFILVVLMLLRAKRKQVEDVFLMSFMLVMLFLATGMFQIFNLGPITMLYPMFREVGHFAPLAVLALLVLMARLMPRGWMKWLSVAWLMIVVVIGFVKYRADTQVISFASVRQQFAEFQQFAATHHDADQRALVYPFFDQLALTKFPMRFQDNLPLRNSGHDSLSAFSSQQFVENSVKPQDFKSSVQYRLLQSMNVDVLQPYNVRYIYDLSNIYESYYDRYVPPSTYGGDVSLIKNNPDFLSQLLEANPGKLKAVSPHILEVTNYAPRISSVSSVYQASSTDDAEAARSFVQQTFPDRQFSYVTPSDHPPAGTFGSVTPLFANPNSPGLIDQHRSSLTQTVTPPPQNTNVTIYSNSIPGEVMYRVEGGSIVFYTASSGKLYANDQLVQDNDSLSSKVLGRIRIVKGVQYYASLNGGIVQIPTTGSGRIGGLDGDSMLEVFVSNAQNVITNSSFESGLWQQKVNDCNAYDKNADIQMNLDDKDATDGSRSLELTARRHDACTYTNFPLSANATYVLSYDYKGQHTQSASSYMRFNNSDQGALRSTQSTSDADWHKATQLITTPENAHEGQLTLHALASDADQPAINHYDNVSLVQLQEVGKLDIPTPKSSYHAYTAPARGSVNVRLQDDSFDFRNIIANGSFEQGAWQDKAADCNNYDKSGSIMASVSGDASDGEHSLQLEATRHTACEHVDVAVQPDTDYLLRFDYKGDPAQLAGYYMEFTGADSGKQEQIPIADNQWHTFTTRVHTPQVVTAGRLYLHAYESDGRTKSVVRYDNVKLIAVPSVDQQFYAVSQPLRPLSKPGEIAFRSISVTEKAAHVQHVSAPFVLSLSETYHAGWRLELDNAQLSRVNAWSPFARVDAAGNHFQLNNYQNAWYIDPAQLCAANAQGCRHNSDGSYDIDLVAEFVPQRWFVVSRGISVATLVVAGGYIAVTHRRHKRQLASEGVYRHVIAAGKGKKK